MLAGYAEARNSSPSWRGHGRFDSLIMKTIFLAAIVPSAVPALRVAGALFLIVNLLGGAYILASPTTTFRSVI